jgi:hypothetical protein
MANTKISFKMNIIIIALANFNCHRTVFSVSIFYNAVTYMIWDHSTLKKSVAAGKNDKKADMTGIVDGFFPTVAG